MRSAVPGHPHYQPAVINLAVESQIAIFPGGMTPTELAAGWHAGATAVKIFPAETVAC